MPLDDVWCLFNFFYFNSFKYILLLCINVCNLYSYFISFFFFAFRSLMMIPGGSKALLIKYFTWQGSGVLIQYTAMLHCNSACTRVGWCTGKEGMSCQCHNDDRRRNRGDRGKTDTKFGGPWCAGPTTVSHRKPDSGISPPLLRGDAGHREGGRAPRKRHGGQWNRITLKFPGEKLNSWENAQEPTLWIASCMCCWCCWWCCNWW